MFDKPTTEIHTKIRLRLLNLQINVIINSCKLYYRGGLTYDVR